MPYLSRKVLPFTFVAALTCAFSPFSSSAFEAEQREDILKAASSPAKRNVPSLLKEIGVDVSPANLAHGILLNRLQYPLSENSLKAASALKQKGQEITSESLDEYLMGQIEPVFGEEIFVKGDKAQTVCSVMGLKMLNDNVEGPFHGYVKNMKGEPVSFSDIDGSGFFG